MKCDWLLLVCALAANGWTADPPTEKMCWAHYVGWGFDQIDGYDRAALSPVWNAQRFNDRSLLGRHAQTDEGVAEATPLQVRTALQYGIDGFCVDLVIRGNSSETFYADAMARFYRAAEGTSFKIALCVDSTDAAADLLTRAFAVFLTRWGRHPNACLVNGRPVVFIYNPRPRTPGEWRDVLAALNARGLSATWLVQPMGEGTLWDNPHVLEEHLAVFDGLYDFGINGFTYDQMLTRLTNGKRALAAVRKPDGLWVAGITQGYLGNANSFYRPSFNTGTLRQNWEAAIQTGAPWVCLTTWNDYVENTHFEPSVVNRDALLRINRDYVARWRGTPLPQRPPPVFVSYHEEVRLGDDLTLEVLSLPYHTAPATLSVRLQPLASAQAASTFTVALPTNETRAAVLRVPHPFLEEGGGVFHVQIRLPTDDASSENWQTLYPIAVRSGHLESLRTLHIPLDELAAEPRLTLASEGGQRIARVRFDRWNLAGTVEILRNGWPVAETGIAHKGAPSVTVSLPLPSTNATPDDLFVARYSTLAGRTAWSPPVCARPAELAAASRLQPVIVSGVDFDEGWRSLSAENTEPPKLCLSPVRANYSLTYPMDEGTGDVLISASEWKTPLLLGRDHRRLLRRDPEHSPQWADDGNGARALFFDGTNAFAVLPSRTFPYGPFTLEMNVRPERTGRPMTLFADPCGVSLALTPDGRVRFARRETALLGQRSLGVSRWTHLAAVYDGEHLRLYVNQTADGETPAEKRVQRINSLPVIGNHAACRSGFRGLLGGLHLQSGVPEEGRFELRPRANLSAPGAACCPQAAERQSR